MNTDFSDVMSKRTNEDLIKIVTLDRDGYQPLAIEAAEKEIKNRNIDTAKFEQVKVEFTAKVKEQKELQKELYSKKVSSLTRFIHLIVDTFAYLIVSMIVDSILRVYINSTFRYLIIAVVFFGYYIFMETKYQKTIGKFITKTKVVNKNGTKPEIGDIVRRTFCRLIPFDRISFLFSPNGFHDSFSNTIVIKDKN